MRGWLLLHRELILEFFTHFGKEMFDCLSGQLDCSFFLLGPSWLETAMSYAAEGYTDPCTIKAYGRVTFESQSWCHGTNTPGITLPALATTVVKAALGIECPGSRQAIGLARGVMPVLVVASTALPAKAGNEPQWKELYDDALRTLR